MSQMKHDELREAVSTIREKREVVLSTQWCPEATSKFEDAIQTLITLAEDVIKEKYIKRRSEMKKIIVITKNTEGNAEVGHTQTIVRALDRDLRLWQAYEQMKKLGNWDIVIPYNQEPE